MGFTVREYLTKSGTSPYRQWLVKLDKTVRARIQARALRFESGNLGDHKFLGDGVCEARVDFGPGYRIYFGKDGDAVIILLCGGDKGTQVRDIGAAQKFWADYLRRGKDGKAQ